MKKATTKFDFRTLLVLMLSLMLCLSMAFAAACSNDNNSSSGSSSSAEEETYPADTQTLTNGDFEFSTFTKDDDDFPVSSSIGWVRSSDSITTSANSSSFASGIINTEDEAYKEIASKAGFVKVGDTDEYYNPHTPYYYGLVENSYVYSEETKNEDGLPMTGTKVLMIHNKVSSNDGEGTAQKFTSSTSLSLAKNEYAKLSVWVLTHDLKSAIEGVDVGAYVAVQNTVSSSASPLIIKNINTSSNWVKYTLYLSASDFSTSSFKVVLGLGFGSNKFRREYVEGFAYFDNVQFETIEKSEYEAGIAGVAAADNKNLYAYDTTEGVYEAVEADDLIVNEADQTYVATAGYSKADQFTATNLFTERTLALSHTRSDKFAANEFDLANGEFTDNRFDSITNQATATKNVSDMTSAIAAINAYLTDKGEETIEAPSTTLTASNTLYFLHSDPTSTSYTTKTFSVKEDGYIKLSFWVKAQVAYPTDTGLTITLNDLGTGNVEKVDTVIASNVNTGDYENENYNDWCEYVIYVSNVLDGDQTENSETRQFTLTFDFGYTGNSLKDGIWGLTEGYAAVIGINGYALTEKDYSIADTSSYGYAKKVALSADLPNGAKEEDNDDTYKFTYSNNDNVTVKTNVASNVIGYTGVVGNSKAVGGTEDSKYSDENVVAGVINTEYTYSSIFTTGELDEINALGKLDENEYLQPLMIKNNAATSFGYYGESATLAANSTTYITVKVKVLGNAIANIYLVNANALDGFEVLKIAAKDYTFENNTLTVSNDYKVNEDLSISVSAADCNNNNVTEDGWFVVRFCIVTGNQSISYRPEFWNGTRDGEEAFAGTVLFDDYTVSTSKTVTDLKNELEIDFNEQPTETKYTRIPTLIKYTDEDGNDAEKYKTYSEESVVLASYPTSKTLIVDYTAIDTVNEEDKRNETSEEDDTAVDSESTSASVDDTDSFSWALQITSIIIAAVLILLLVVVLIKVLVDKYGKKKNSSVTYYNRDSRDLAGAKAEEKKAKQTEYDYDNIENNIESDDAE